VLLDAIINYLLELKLELEIEVITCNSGNSSWFWKLPKQSWQDCHPVTGIYNTKHMNIVLTLQSIDFVSILTFKNKYMKNWFFTKAPVSLQAKFTLHITRSWCNTCISNRKRHWKQSLTVPLKLIFDKWQGA